MEAAKIIKRVIWTIVGLAAALAATIGIVAIVMNEPFPIDKLTIFDATLYGYWKQGQANKFDFHIQNNADYSVSQVNVRIDFYDNSGHPIDGTTVQVYDQIPGHSTRHYAEQIAISGLPPAGKWKWSYKITSAKRH